MRKKRAPDFLLFFTVLSLLSLGLVMVLSSSEYAALVYYGDGLYFFKRQLLHACLGLAALFFFLRYDYWQFRRLTFPLLGLSFIFLILVLIPGVGDTSHGAQRWISIGSFSFQPAEIVKFGLLLFVADGLSRRGAEVRKFKALLPYLGVTGLAALLILLEPDLGTALALAGTVFVLLFCAGVPLSTLGLLGLAGLACVGLAIKLEPYRLKRLFAFLDPWKDPLGAGFHIIQSLYAIGSGGLFGLGLGQGKQKLLYLPEQHTDFIFAVIGEELGFIGALLVITLFVILIWRGLRTALYAPDAFGCYLAAGITAGIGLQAFINIGVVTGSLPITGIPLPLISYGGTSLVFTLASIGILLNISRYSVR
ncbi:putative lipid II flippase FtsW [Ammonifex thiophilus]|uniref:Probable peptidoglycan glycosyltransferase FtsW n=1 Tax=Ammonifex thiophilus TaxID=444093 RepID=A0A3D8P568_9THEO|nr:putative lipid II flippase FtsW [Ammonifex thiophilus]RDV82902.1 putative lipid II flippase FtsW [Ammonifex thiophilus]